jgi:hypothetical protein
VLVLLLLFVIVLHTFLGGSMAIASFCGMEICTGLAESCLEESLLRDRRNCRHSS